MWVHATHLNPPGVQLVVASRAFDIVRPESVSDVRRREGKVRLVRKRIPRERVNVAGKAHLVAVVSQATPPSENHVARFFSATDVVRAADFIGPDRWIHGAPRAAAERPALLPVDPHEVESGRA